MILQIWAKTFVCGFTRSCFSLRDRHSAHKILQRDAESGHAFGRNMVFVSPAPCMPRSTSVVCMSRIVSHRVPLKVVATRSTA